MRRGLIQPAAGGAPLPFSFDEVRPGGVVAEGARRLFRTELSHIAHSYCVPTSCLYAPGSHAREFLKPASMPANTFSSASSSQLCRSWQGGGPAEVNFLQPYKAGLDRNFFLRKWLKMAFFGPFWGVDLKRFSRKYTPAAFGHFACFRVPAGPNLATSRNHPSWTPPSGGGGPASTLYPAIPFWPAGWSPTASWVEGCSLKKFLDACM